MPELIVTQATIDRAYELRETRNLFSLNIARCCPMGLQMCKYLGLKEGTYEWGYDQGYKGGKLCHISRQANEAVVVPFSKSLYYPVEKLTGPVAVDIEEVS